MRCENTVDPDSRYSAISLLLAWALAACTSSGAGAPPGGSNDVDSGHGGGDATILPSSDGSSGTVTGPGDAGEPPDGSPGQDGTSSTDGGVALGDGGGAGSDGGLLPADGGAADGGLRNVGSCCSAQTTPGCGNANLEVCVCEKDQSCCTTAWGVQCALIVQQKFCQPTVRDCVCGSDAGQWDQTQCCTTDWSSTCDIVAAQKCNAVQGCF
jgi:hypothetical protein